LKLTLTFEAAFDPKARYWVGTCKQLPGIGVFSSTEETAILDIARMAVDGLVIKAVGGEPLPRDGDGQ
jgi:hypothetical protein